MDLTWLKDIVMYLAAIAGLGIACLHDLLTSM